MSDRPVATRTAKIEHINEFREEDDFGPLVIAVVFAGTTTLFIPLQEQGYRPQSLFVQNPIPNSSVSRVKST
ncbi:MAG: hypothetical protein Q8L77_06735 [Nitrospirota bacterium]|nr:hypothetical protein [Nitrospirota bacterium]